MLRYIVRRVLWGIALLFIVTALIFFIFYVMPSGDPAVSRAGRLAGPEEIERIRETLGLDDPIYVQYWYYVRDLVLHLDFGYSYESNAPVRELIFDRLPATISLVAGAVVLWLLVAFPVGIVSAIRRGSALDRTMMVTTLALVSAPVFWLGLVLLYLFAEDVGQLLPIFPGQGSYTELGLHVGITPPSFEIGNPWDWASALILPWLVLAAAFAAIYARYVRSSLIDVMGEDYIRTARAKGLAERRVVMRHGVRSAVTPVVTLLGVDIGLLLAGNAILTESVFNIPGVGRLIFSSIDRSDLPVVQGVVLFGAFFIIVLSLIVDIVYAYLDPRVRYA
jgi:peptide/nickel transport system permease protein